MTNNSLKLTTKANAVEMFIGIDSIDKAVDRDHFIKYPKKIIYNYNQMGYRDEEWPESVTDQIWTVGDSFTVGIGQPYQEIWPKLLEKTLNCRVINLSMNGASNDWISRKINYIINNFEPAAIFVQWSYLHRREIDNPLISDEERSLHFDPNDDKDLDNFLKNIYSIDWNKTKTVHSFVPKFHSLWGDRDLDQLIYSMLKNLQIKYFEPPPQTDFSRDGHHYDIETASAYVQKYIQLYQEYGK